MRGCTPTKLMISELLEATPKEANESSPKTTPATVKERLTRRNPTPNGPDDLSWADDGSLSLPSKQHWFEGLWAFDTCNPKPWPGAKKYLERIQADCVAIQKGKHNNERVCGDGAGGKELRIENCYWCSYDH